MELGMITWLPKPNLLDHKGYLSQYNDERIYKHDIYKYYQQAQIYANCNLPI